jgi:hypothetical protein
VTGLDDYSVAQYHGAISAALRAHDMEAVHALLCHMAVRHPREAEYLRDLMLLAARSDS